jgi:deazaflavin-dependent oxidoreductase (nitroreductase family)
MSNDMTTTNDIQNFNQQVIAEFRATQGKMDSQAGQQMLIMMSEEKISECKDPLLLLLTTTGAKSGQPRTTPTAYTTDGDRLVIIASLAGAPNHPDWYYNVVANPAVTVEVGDQKFQARAVIAEGQERDRLYAQMVEQIPQFKGYERKTSRKFPVVLLERVGVIGYDHINQPGR